MPARLDFWLIDLRANARDLARIALERNLLDRADRDRHAGYRDPQDAATFAASRGALALVLESQGLPAGAPLRRTRSGKPFADGAPGFSLSRTVGWVAIAAVSRGEIGIDIEARRPLAATEPIVGRAARLIADDVDPLAAWTMIEAWCKHRGVMLAALLDSPTLQRQLEAALATGPLPLTLPLPPGLVGHAWHDEGDIAVVQHDLVLPSVR